MASPHIPEGESTAWTNDPDLQGREEVKPHKPGGTLLKYKSSNYTLGVVQSPYSPLMQVEAFPSIYEDLDALSSPSALLSHPRQGCQAPDSLALTPF